MIGTDRRDQAFALISTRMHDFDHIPASILTHSPHVDRGRIWASSDGPADEDARRRATELLDDYEATVELSVELSLIAAAVLRCWAAEIGVPPETLLQDLALTQARDTLF